MSATYNPNKSYEFGIKTLRLFWDYQSIGCSKEDLIETLKILIISLEKDKNEEK